MTYGRAFSVTIRATTCEIVTIEATSDPGLPSVCALSAPELHEVRDRARAAITNSATDAQWPDTRVSLIAQPVRPQGDARHDLAVAVAVLRAAGTVAGPDRAVFLAELSLDGRLRPTRGLLAAVVAARDAGFDTAVVAGSAQPQLPAIDGITVHGAATLAEVLDWLHGRPALTTGPGTRFEYRCEAPDLTTIAGQTEAKWLLEVAAAGGHHLAVSGPAGSGKTLLAQCLPGILPPLPPEQALDVAAVHSLRGTTVPTLTTAPPCAAPHHSTSVPVLFGGLSTAVLPGHASLAHHGVLLLDEITAFAPQALDTLRVALDHHEVQITRSDAVFGFPAAFQLVAVVSECLCGATQSARCACTPTTRARHHRNLTTVADRIDLWAHLPSPPVLGVDPGMQSSAAVRDRVIAARRRAVARWSGVGYTSNAEVPGHVLRHSSCLPHAAQDQITTAVRQGLISERGADSVRRVAWTLADLRAADLPAPEDVGAALALRQRPARR